ncbi:MAG: hypothetical protein Q8S29_20715 [Phreatobacter sp.]|nr:hypothetical protein [Phreatobacter sp.]
MPHRDALASLSQALAAIDVMIRSGKGQGGRLVEMAREARHSADQLSRQNLSQASAATQEGAHSEKV